MASAIRELATLLNQNAENESNSLQSRHQQRIQESKDILKEKERYAIWDDSEIEEIKKQTGANIKEDSRLEPEFNVRYRQNISTEDIYLGMGGKLNSMSHSDEIVAYIQLPKYLEKQKQQNLSTAEIMKEIDLDVRENHIDLRSLIYRCTITLPQSINPSKSTAKWDSNSGLLTITCPVQNLLSKFLQ